MRTVAHAFAYAKKLRRRYGIQHKLEACATLQTIAHFLHNIA